MWLQDSGILKKLIYDELRAPNQIPLPKVKHNQPLSIYQLATALYALLGIVASLLAFCLELIKGREDQGKIFAPRKSHDLAMRNI